jgi:hypothetical protein
VIQINADDKCATQGLVFDRDMAVSDTRKISPTRLARGADRLYGELLIVLAVFSAAAPLFVEATLAWSLLLGGLAGLWWIALDRTPRGMVAAAGWAFITLGLGAHLTFHVGLGVLPLDVTLGLGFVLLGVAEVVLGAERYRNRPLARFALSVGGAVAVAFGIAFPFVWSGIPSWLGSTTMAVMYATFGIGLLIGDASSLTRRRDAAAQ